MASKLNTVTPAVQLTQPKCPVCRAQMKALTDPATPLAWQCPQCHKYQAYTEAELAALHEPRDMALPEWTGDKLAKHLRTAVAAGVYPVRPRPAKRRNPLKFSICSWCKRDFKWMMKRSGKIVAVSGTNYSSKAKCKQTLVRLLATIAAESYIWEK